MFTILFDHFLNTLAAAVLEAEQAITEATNAYQLATVSLALTGVKTATVYQQVPEMHPRTVRRCLAGAKDAVLMCMSDLPVREQEHKDSNESGVLADIQQAAERAKVKPAVAIAAVTRFLNAPSRVQAVLADIRTLQTENCRVWNPTGLFTRLMRSGQDVRLPARLQEAREQATAEKQVKKSRPVPAPGVLVKLYGEVCSIIEVTRQFALVRTSIDDIRVPLDSLRYP